MVLQTTPRSAVGETPLSLCFGVEATIQVEIGSKSLKNITFDGTLNDK